MQKSRSFKQSKGLQRISIKASQGNKTCRDFVLGFNDMSTLVDHFVLSPREREKRERRDSTDERQGQGRKRKKNESEETVEIKTFPLYPYLLQMSSLRVNTDLGQHDTIHHLVECTWWMKMVKKLVEYQRSR